MSEEGGSERIISSGPPLEGHPVIHESAVPCASLEMFHAVILTRVREVISESLVKNRGIRRLDNVIQAFESKNLQAEEDCVLWLAQGSPQYKVRTRTSCEETEVILVPREEWLNLRSLGVPVACNRPQENGERVHGEYLTRGVGVACVILQEGGKWVYRCQGLNCSAVGQELSMCGLNTSCVQGGRWKSAHQRDLCRMLDGKQWRH